MAGFQAMLTWARTQLERAGVEDAGREAIYLLEWATERSYGDWVAHPGDMADAPTVKFVEGVKTRAARTPFAYITGMREFYGLTLRVSPAVLIPRPETEDLVEEVLRVLPTTPQRIVDVGTGSGAIALALKQQRPQWTMTGVDVSPTALQIAQKNGQLLGLEVTWLQSDLLTEVDGQFDAITANLPYIPFRDAAELSPELSFEPQDALFAGHEGLALIDRLIDQSLRHLVAGGLLFLECGIGQAEVISGRMRQLGYGRVSVKEDLAGIPRVVYGRREGLW